VTTGPFNAKVSYAVTDYFGLMGETAAFAYFSALPDKGNSKGTVYVEANYTLDLGDKLSLGAMWATRQCAITASSRTPTPRSR